MFVSNARPMRGFVLGVLSWALAGQVGLAQDPPAAAPSEPEAKAAALFESKDWAGSIEAYEAITFARPSNAQAWFNLGAAHHALGQWQEAFNTYTQAGSAGYAPVAIATRLSRVLSRWGKKDAALAELSKAVKLGLTRLEVVEKDPDFEPIRSDLRFAKLVLEVKKKVDPCSVSPEYGQLGFWVGVWDVQVPAGKSVATSHITSILNGCAIHEDYVQNDGAYAGQSLSAWSASTKQWSQRYVDSKGEVQEWTGEAEGASLRFLREGKGPDGKPARFRMTYTAEGTDRVRQFIERSADRGKSWIPEFDGVYVRTKGAP
ncbi:MAG: tetratricopeptide repeat protein [Acidobacteriota bacterium]